MRGERFVAPLSRLALAAGMALLLLGPARAQVLNGNQWPNPRLTALTPTGGKPGTTFEVGFAGTETDAPQGLLFSHPGIKAEPIIPPPPKVDPKAKPDPKKKPAPPTPITRLRITIAPDVPIGSYDVRLVNKYGVSNPRVFVVTDLNPLDEKEPNNDVEQAQKIAIGTVISGSLANGVDVEYSQFTGKKGQRVLVHCMAASIDSRLQPELRVFDMAGRQIAYDRASVGQDGLVDVTLPEDGDYRIRLNQFAYTGGGADYFYRLNVSTGPWVDAVFPPMVEPGKSAQITLFGRNLPGGKADPTALVDGRVLDRLTVTVNAPAADEQLTFEGLIGSQAATLDGFTYRFRGPTGVANPRLLTFATAPVVLENDDNDTAAKAQLISTPCEVAGRVDKRRDRDWFVFEAKKGQTLMIEAYSHRLGAPTDLYVSVRNLQGKTPQEITLLDDPNAADNLGMRIYTSSNDPAPYRFVAPADGKYHLLVASHTADTQADPTHIYRLRLTPPRPDFRLVAMPADKHRPDTLSTGPSGRDHYTVFASRRDGFKGDITLTVEGLPPGLTSPPQILSRNMKSAHLVLTAAPDAKPFTGTVRVVGTALIDGKKVARTARPATVTWPVQPQQNIPTITRLDHALMLAVRDKGPGLLTAATDKLTVKLGEKVVVGLKLQRHLPEFKGNFQVTPVQGDFPPNLNIPNVTFAPGKDDQKVSFAVPANVPPGTYNLVFRGFAPVPLPKVKGKNVNAVLVSSPVTLTVLPTKVANLTVDNANLTVKTGAEGTVAVRVARLYDYADAFKVELIVPPNVKALRPVSATIAPGANEVKLKFQVPQGTPPGNVPNLVIRATAVVNGNVTLVHETKINVNVVKK